MAEIDPRIQAQAPSDDTVTYYDRQHFLTYARLIDADNEGADWRKSAASILYRDVESEPAAAELCYRTHLARARWIADADVTKARSENKID